MCIIHGLQTVLNRVYCVYHKGCSVCILHHYYSEKMTSISNMIYSNQNKLKKIIESRDKSNIKMVHTYLKLFFVLLCSVQGRQCVLYNKSS